MMSDTLIGATAIMKGTIQHRIHSRTGVIQVIDLLLDGAVTVA
jgi:hypothetical protein